MLAISYEELAGGWMDTVGASQPLPSLLKYTGTAVSALPYIALFSGVIALPGAALGAGVGYLFGSVLPGAAIGATLSSALGLSFALNFAGGVGQSILPGVVIGAGVPLAGSLLGYLLYGAAGALVGVIVVPLAAFLVVRALEWEKLQREASQERIVKPSVLVQRAF